LTNNTSCFPEGISQRQPFQPCIRDTVAAEIRDVGYFWAMKKIAVQIRNEVLFVLHKTFHHNWKLRSRCLQISFIPEDHTGENLDDAMGFSLQAWQLDVTKQVCLTTDSGVNTASKLENVLLWTQLTSQYYQV